jgi:hypothetical protein
LVGEIHILADNTVPHEIIAKRFGAEGIGERIWVTNVAQRFAHLIAIDEDVTMDKKRRHVIIVKAHRLEHCQPVDAMRRDEDIFADNVQSRPTLAKSNVVLEIAGETDVVHQGIEPDIGHTRGVKWQLDSPGETRLWARDR